MRLAEVALEEAQIAFRLVQQHERPGAVQRHLTGELGADGARGPGDEDRLALDVRRQLGQLEHDGLAAEEVLDAHLAQVAEAYVARQHLGDPRQDAERQVGALAVLHDPAQVGRTRGRNREHDLVRVDLLGDLGEALGRAHDPDPLDRSALLGALVVGEGHRSVPRREADHLARQQVPGLARAHDEDASVAPRLGLPELSQPLEGQPVREPDPGQQVSVQDPVDEQHGARDPGP